MAKIILRNFVVVHDSFENAVKDIGAVRESDGRGEVEHFSRLRADGDLFVFDLPVFAFGIVRDEKISFEAGVGKLAGTKSEVQHNEKRLLVFRKLRAFQRAQKGFYLFNRQSVVRNSIRLLERDQRHGIVCDNPAVYGVFENLRKECPQILIQTPFYSRHDPVYIDRLDKQDRFFTENRGDIPPVLTFVIVPRLRNDFPLLIFEPLRGNFVEQIFSARRFLHAVIVYAIRSRFFQELLFRFL